jgi:hypothetical protein
LATLTAKQTAAEDAQESVAVEEQIYLASLKLA